MTPEDEKRLRLIIREEIRAALYGPSGAPIASPQPDADAITANLVERIRAKQARKKAKSQRKE